MSFTPDVTLTGLNAVTATYSEISLEKGTSLRKDSTRELGTPCTLKISHEVSGKGASSVDRHLVRLDKIEPSPATDSVEVASCSVYTVLTVPRNPIITKSIVIDLLTQLGGFLADEANVAKLLNGEP